MESNFDFEKYLDLIRELQEEKSIHEETIKNMQLQYEKMGIAELFQNAKRYHFDGSDLGEIIFTAIVPCMGVYGLLLIPTFLAGSELIAMIAFPACILLALIITIVRSVKRVNFYYTDWKRRQREVEECRKKAHEQAEYEEEELKPAVLEKIQFYQKQLEQIKEKLATLYNADYIPRSYRIPERYQKYNTAVLFFEYVETGRCDTAKECMLKFDNDAEIMNMHKKIDLMEAKLEDFRDSTLKQIAAVRRSMEKSIQRTERLISASQEQMADKMDQLEHNRHVANLIMYDFLHDLDN